jgi:pimeloyl-ACP methyl ester carboxylesterase
MLLCSSFLGAVVAFAEPAPPARAESCPAGKLMPAAAIACRQLAKRDVFCQPLSEARRELLPGIGYYTLQVQVGPGEHDIITLHRVVAEKQPGRPAAARRAVFMISGANHGFASSFLALSLYAEPPQASLPVLLARSGVEAWGISFRWAQIPVGFPDQSFMADWGMDVAVSDARVGLRIARIAGRLAGHGTRRLHVLGASLGAWTAMALANAEVSEPPQRRDIRGLILVEGASKADPAETAYVQAVCDDYASAQGQMDAGQYGSDLSFFPWFNQLVLDDPDAECPFRPGFTNRQVALLNRTVAQNYPGNEWFHHFAGIFDEGGTPTALAYTDFVFSAVATTKVFGYNPIRYARDAFAVTCGVPDVPWDDHLAEVTVPALYLGAGGGTSSLGEYQTRLLGSEDVTTRVVRRQPPELAALDIGHSDILWAPAMRDLFWEPILAWIRAH